MKNIFLFGYSGHSYVVHDCVPEGYVVSGYFDQKENVQNPLHLDYLGDENNQDLSKFKDQGYVFPSVGNNTVRRKLIDVFQKNNLKEITLIHKTASVSKNSKLGLSTMIGPAAVVNAFASIGNGVIINSGAIIEHECHITDYSHIAPGAVLAGNVSVGEGSFIGANSVVKEGVKIGKNAIIGAGSVVLNDVPDNEMWVGIPAIKKQSVGK